MSDKKTRLGRGLDVLIPTDIDSLIADTDDVRVQSILVSTIHANPQQPRRAFDEHSIEELSKSIKRHGVLQPIIVVTSDNGYSIVAGERRWRAARRAKLTHIPAIVRSLEELEQVELALIENIQRVDLSPLEQAMSIYKLQHQFNLSLEEIAEKLGKAQSTVSNLARLLKLPDSAREALRSGKITEGHARAILSLNKDSDKQEQLLHSILNNNLNVRDAEAFANQVKGRSKQFAKRLNEDEVKMFTTQISGAVSMPVKSRSTKSGNQLIITYKSIDELADLANKLIRLENN